MSNPKILIATSPFGATGAKPLELLRETGWELISNPKGRRLKPGEIGDMVKDVDAVIAGTEPYTREVIAGAGRLKVIARVGIGLDSVDIPACREKGVAVTYTPEAPSQAVAELAVGQIINLARGLLKTDRSVREGAWNRYMGQLVSDLTVGVIGVGRIGKRIIRLLQPFGPTILACDLEPDEAFASERSFEWAPAERIFAESDVVTVHIPLNRRNRHFVSRERIASMKTGACLINTSRGPVVDTEALTDAVVQHHLGGAALDVFESEPYEGPLTRYENVILSAHIGGSTRTSRYFMELGAAEDCIRILRGEPPANPAPDPED